MLTRRTAIFASPVDLLDEGVSTVFERVQARAGLGGVILAVAYHAARDLLPHNPRRVVASLESGVTYFPNDLRRYTETRLTPRPAAGFGGRDLLAESVAEADRLGMAAHAWVVLTHNSRLASAHPDVGIRTVFGDRLTHGLCPSHQSVERFAEVLVTEIAERRPGAIYLESADFPGYDHGGHHERTLVRLDQFARRLMGLCFCPACAERAVAADIDVTALRRAVRLYLRTAFDDEPGHRAASDTNSIPYLDAYLRVRQDTVTGFVATMAAAVRRVCPPTRVVFLDVGAAGGQGGAAAADGWRWSGIDLPRLAEIVDAVAFTAYSRTATVVGDLAAAYRRQVGDLNLEAVLRPGWPDSESPAALRRKLHAVAAHGVTDLGFYHYGLMRLSALDLIRISRQ
jgi:hypothetical protein